jgi:SAM-dependent methyltransferase
MKRYCLVCHSALGIVHPHEDYLKCIRCGSFCVNRIPKKREIITGLNRWADEITYDEDQPIHPTKTMYQRVNTLIHLHHNGKKLLDVGCGKIDFLVTAKNAGFDVSGMDIAGPIIKQLVRNMIPAYTSLTKIEDSVFDVVTCFDVIEHTTDLKSFMDEICRVMKQKGIVFLSTPNASSISAKLLGKSWWVFGPDGHYVLCTPIGLRRLLERSGFSIISFETNTITQWIHTKSQVVNKIGNKIIYCILFPLLPFLYRQGLGDNIEVIAKKTSTR